MCSHLNRLLKAILIYHFQYKKKITLNYPKSAAMGFCQGTQERVRNSRGKQAFSVPATEVLLYIPAKNLMQVHPKKSVEIKKYPLGD